MTDDVTSLNRLMVQVIATLKKLEKQIDSLDAIRGRLSDKLDVYEAQLETTGYRDDGLRQGDA